MLVGLLKCRRTQIQLELQFQLNGRPSIHSQQPIHQVVILFTYILENISFQKLQQSVWDQSHHSSRVDISGNYVHRTANVCVNKPLFK